MWFVNSILIHGARRRCHKRYIRETRVRLKDHFDENWRPVNGSTASVSRSTAVSDYFLSHDFSSTHIDLIPWELVHIKLKKHILLRRTDQTRAQGYPWEIYSVASLDLCVDGTLQSTLAVEGLGYTWPIFTDLLQHFSSWCHHIISLRVRRRGGCVCRSTWFNLQKLECGGSYSSLVLGRHEKPNFVLFLLFLFGRSIFREDAKAKWRADARMSFNCVVVRWQFYDSLRRFRYRSAECDFKKRLLACKFCL